MKPQIPKWSDQLTSIGDPRLDDVPDSTTNPESQEATTNAVARAYLRAFATGDPQQIAAHVADDFVNEHTAALGSGCAGKSAYLERLPGFLADMADLEYRIESVVVEGDVAVAFYTMTASWQGDHPISVRGVQRLVVEKGKITHRTDYWDSANFLTQVSSDARDALRPFGIN